MPNLFHFPKLSSIMARRDQTERPPAVVASVFQTGLNLMRDLEQKGVRTVGVDCNPQNPGFRSKYGKSFLCPNPDSAPEEWLRFMISLATAIGEKAVIIAASDIYVSAIGRFATDLQPHFIFSEAGAKLQASLATKEKQYALAKKYGLPRPRDAYIQSADDIEEFCREARFPVLLKPRHQREWLALPESNPLRYAKTVSAQNAPELLRHYAVVSHLVPEAVLQEEIVGPDSAKYCYLSVYAQSRQRLGACVVQELRAYPLLYGCATMVKPVVDEEIDRVCNEFLTAIGYIGLCEIELKRDTRDGKLLLIEVNPRFSGTGDSAKYTGVETGYLHYLDLVGQTPAPVTPTNFNFTHFMLAADLAAFPKYRQQGVITWRDWISSHRGPVKYFDFDPADFANARRTLASGLRSLLGGLSKSGRTKR